MRSKLPAVVAVAVLLVLWQLASVSGLIPAYLLPSPVKVFQALYNDRALLAEHALVTLQEALYGLVLGVAIGFFFAVLMDAFEVLYRAVYPILILSQTIPTVAIAPLLVLWFGSEMLRR